MKILAGRALVAFPIALAATLATTALGERHDFASALAWAIGLDVTEALAIVDASARHVVVIPLHDRHATSFIPKFLDQVVFRQGPPEVLHSDAA